MAPQHENYELADQLHAINHILRRRWAAQLAPFDLSPHHYRALATLVRADAADATDAEGASRPRSGGMRVTEIAERLRIAPRSATEVIDLLEVKGLVQRGPDPADRRAIRVSASDKGHRVYALVRSERRQQAEEFFSVLEEEDRCELSRLLGQLVDAHRRSAHA